MDTVASPGTEPALGHFIKPAGGKRQQDENRARAAGNAALQEARSKAREWADTAIDLNQAGDTDGARRAARLATGWLGTMLDIETWVASEARCCGLAADGPNNPISRRRKAAKRRTASQLRLSSAHALPDSNNLMLRAWQRSL